MPVSFFQRSSAPQPKPMGDGSMPNQKKPQPLASSAEISVDSIDIEVLGFESPICEALVKFGQNEGMSSYHLDRVALRPALGRNVNEMLRLLLQEDLRGLSIPELRAVSRQHDWQMTTEEGQRIFLTGSHIGRRLTYFTTSTSERPYFGLAFPEEPVFENDLFAVCCRKVRWQPRIRYPKNIVNGPRVTADTTVEFPKTASAG